MSGHSKWSKIKRQKEVGDTQRGQLFTKLGRAITLAVKESGGNGDIASNFKLRIIVEKAKQNNMPKDNIQRAIDRGTGKDEGGSILEEALYEGYGPHGVALIIEVVTDNKMRTSAQVKHVLSRCGGTLSAQGSVAFQFDHQGYMVIEKGSYNEDTLLSDAIEAGATDMEGGDDAFEIYTDRATLHSVKEAIVAKGYVIAAHELIYRPTITVSLDTAHEHALTSCIEQLEELEDVQKVYSNDVPTP